MIVLDTNVVSELMRTEPDAAVLGWVDSQPTDRLFITAITVAELFYGVTRLADGRRKREPAGIIEVVVEEDFAERVVAFDDVAARHYADIATGRERAGRPISMADAQVAAICRSHAAIVATRNVGDFANTGVAVLDPWEPQPSAK